MGRWLIANSRYDCLVHSRLTKIISLIISFCLILEQSVFAQTIDLSHYFARGSAPQSDKFRPLHLRYISYDNQANDFKLLIDKGDFFNQKTEKTLELEKNTQELMKYFFIGLTLPNEKFWVNLRPDSPDNILDPDLEKTDIGRIFLEADLQLKKDTSGMTSPQNPQGKEYWDKLYKKAGELFGTKNISIPTITRPWIVPNEIIIRESPEGAYIYKATLKVMLEEDYLNQKTEKPENGKTEVYNFSDPRLKELNEYSTQLIKESIIPKLTYELNASKRYAPLRQVYYSLILAQWFKQKYGSVRSIRAPDTRAPVNNYIDMIDSGNLANLTSNQPYDKQSYFQQYQKSFQDGEYNLQEPIYTPMGQSIRRYVSGGINGLMAGSALTVNSVGMGLENNYLMPVAYDGAGIVSSAVMDKSDKNHAASSAVESLAKNLNEKVKGDINKNPVLPAVYESLPSLSEQERIALEAASKEIPSEVMKDIGHINWPHELSDKDGVNLLLDVVNELAVPIKDNGINMVLPIGDSAKWVVETFRLFFPQTKVKYLPFSKGWHYQYSDARPPAISDMEIYIKKVLKELDLNEIVNSNGKVMLIDLMLSGNGLRSFLDILLEWAKKEGISEDALKEKFVICVLINDAVPSYIESKSFYDFTIREIGINERLLLSLGDNGGVNDPNPDRIIPYYSSNEWGVKNPDIVYLPDKSCLIAFSIIHHLTVLKNDYEKDKKNNKNESGKLDKRFPKLNFSSLFNSDDGKGVIAGSTNSPLTTTIADELGGIAFNALPIQTQAMPVVSSAITSNFKPLSSSELDAEWAQIEAMVNAAIRPAPERLERYAASVSSSLDYPRVRDKFVGLFADILRNDETSQRQLRLEPALRNILLALESE